MICMVELGELENKHSEFDKRHVRVVVVSNDPQAVAQKTQADFPHLVVVSDAQQKLAKALDVIHPGAAPDGGDTNAPTTILIDGRGTFRWLFRPDRVLVRLSPEEVLDAVDQNLKTQ
jgi:peroxiredoxin